MTEFRKQAERLLEDVGIVEASVAVQQLTSLLSDRAWAVAERGTAHGAHIGTRQATCIAAKSLSFDPAVQPCLAALGVEPAVFAARIVALVERLEGSPLPPQQPILRRRRWGDESQPRGSAPPAEDGPHDGPTPATDLSLDSLIGLPVYGPGRELVGAIAQVFRDREKLLGVQLDDRPPSSAASL